MKHDLPLIVVAVVIALAFLVDESDCGCLCARRRIACEGFSCPAFHVHVADRSHLTKPHTTLFDSPKVG